MKRSPPAYLDLHARGELSRRAATARELLCNCAVCPHRCRVDRLDGETGLCNTGARVRVCSAHAHFGEEPPLVGKYGSGTIFFSWCNLRCVFCQNADISASGMGQDLDAENLAQLMLDLQTHRCENINFVSPSHVVPQILEALVIAADRGLDIPLVYNSGGYDRTDTLELLDGVFDIYMPDMKYGDAMTAERLSGAADYPAVNQAAVREMHRQTGDLAVDARGVARKGLLVRHLVLPGNLAGTNAVMEFLAHNISRDTYVNVMAQYHPGHHAEAFAPLNRRISREEYAQAVESARRAGLHRFAR